MFVVNDMPKQIDRSLVELLEQAETATIGHVLYEGFVDRGIAAPGIADKCCRIRIAGLIARINYALDSDRHCAHFTVLLWFEVADTSCRR